MAEGSGEHSGVGIALGVEKIGLLSLRGPLVTAIVAILISVAAVFGLMRIKVDDSLSQLFRSGFSSQSHLTATLSKQLGTTPRKIRTQG